MTESGALALREALRNGDSPFVKNRRAIAGLSLFSSAILGGVALFQVGLLRKLPDLPGQIWNADEVHGSAAAYARFETPDALLGLASYAVTACLAGMGDAGRWKTHRWMPLGMGAKVLIDAAMAAMLSRTEAVKLRKFSIWSCLVAASTIGSLALAFGETKAALASNPKASSREH